MIHRAALSAVLLSLAALPWVAAEDPVDSRTRERAAPADPARDAALDVDKNEQSPSAPRSRPVFVHRATQIAGMRVLDGAGKEIGSVKDIVIDLGAGEVKYAALSYGGFLGVGDKLFAVPWDAFGHAHDVKNNEYLLTFRVDEASLKAAPGFDQDKWPNFADTQFSGGIDKYYSKYRANKKRPQSITGSSEGAKAVATEAVGSLIHRAESVMAMSVRNASGVKLGDVDDLVIEMESGRVRYAALSYGGFLGLGDKRFAVPWSAFKTHFDTSEAEYYLVVHLDEAMLRKATGFNSDAWPNFADPKITSAIDRYYERKADAAEAVRARDTR